MYSVRFQPLRLQCRVCLASAPSERRLYSVTRGQYEWRERRALASERRKISAAHIVPHVASTPATLLLFLNRSISFGNNAFKENNYYLFYR